MSRFQIIDNITGAVSNSLDAASLGKAIGQECAHRGIDPDDLSDEAIECMAQENGISTVAMMPRMLMTEFMYAGYNSEKRRK